MEKIYTSKDHSADIMGSIAQLWQNNKYCDAVLEIGSEKLEVNFILLYLLYLFGCLNALPYLP